MDSSYLVFRISYLVYRISYFVFRIPVAVRKSTKGRLPADSIGELSYVVKRIMWGQNLDGRLRTEDSPMDSPQDASRCLRRRREIEEGRWTMEGISNVEVKR